MKTVPILLTVCLALAACSQQPTPTDSGIPSPAAWQYAEHLAQAADNRLWWQDFNSPELDTLISQARAGSHDLAAAMARVRQAQASARIAGAPLLPELSGNLTNNRQSLISGDGYRQLDVDRYDRNAEYFETSLVASYELDFWGGKQAAVDSAGMSLRASEFDRSTVELTLLSGVASTYLQARALQAQAGIAELNLTNAERVLQLVQTRFQSGAATALELAQQKSLVATQQRQLPLLRQQAREALISLATLLGEPVQNLRVLGVDFESLTSPDIGAGLPSELLGRRPDIAAAEARLSAAQADVRVARAAMLPKITLTATLGSGADKAHDILQNPFYNLTSGLVAPIFNNGRLRGERDRNIAKQQELLENYRGTIVSAFADVEKALNSIDGLDQQHRWQHEELSQAQRAFDIAEARYRAGAEDLLTVLQTQRTLYEAQNLNVQLRLSRLQASVALYKALGGGWKADAERM
ncbi:RND transporter [Pseudomonas sp. S25]|uniref:RND transporter n=1 Tax=Pseudomonas maioricensis TaxID=1766623 RepID=A0ABS9ZRC4_9PSED|nr:efflux transporter outer membrane subunit [Pseudomonas sp. S25]MCI8213027.1 RND transporter [Pseudomonas sp. S25]